MTSKRVSRYNREFKRMRQKVLDRDNYKCVLCGAKADHVHHIVFRSQCGSNKITNLASLCIYCHQIAHGVNAKYVRAILQEYTARK